MELDEEGVTIKKIEISKATATGISHSLQLLNTLRLHVTGSLSQTVEYLSPKHNVFTAWNRRTSPLCARADRGQWLCIAEEYEVQINDETYVQKSQYET